MSHRLASLAMHGNWPDCVVASSPILDCGIHRRHPQLAQQGLHSQIHDVSHASHVLFLLVKRYVADAAPLSEETQEVVDVGRVVGGDAQKCCQEPRTRHTP